MNSKTLALLAVVILLASAGADAQRTNTKKERPARAPAASKPSAASQPTDQRTELRARLRDLLTRLKAAEETANALESEMAAGLEADPAYAQAKAETAAALERKEAIRATGTVQEKLDAAGVWGKARQSMLKAKNDYEARSGVAEAKELERKLSAQVDVVNQQLARVERDIAEAKRKADEEAAIPVLSIKQLELTGERYVGQTVKMAGQFGRAGSSRVDSLPGITTASNGLLSSINTSEKAKWLDFSFTDKDRNSLWDAFAPKEQYIEMMLSLEEGTPIRIRGVVVELFHRPGDFGIVCETIERDEVKPPEDPATVRPAGGNHGQGVR